MAEYIEREAAIEACCGDCNPAAYSSDCDEVLPQLRGEDGGAGMSECVVRIEMPKSCPCELAGGYDIPLPCFAGHGIPKRCKEFDECVEKGTKPDWCPFICALPEGHGRLVDADMLKQKWLYGGNDGKPYRDEIDSMPTIVPAERSEE